MYGKEIFQLVRRTAAAALLFTLLPFTAAFAQDSASADETIDLRIALELALERNLTLRQSTNDVVLSETGLSQERADFYPNLTVSAGPSVRIGRGFDETTGNLTDQRNEGLNVNASSSINLFNGFSDVASLSQARSSLDASQFNHERVRQEILHQTSSRYLQLFLAEELILVEEENLASQEQQLAAIEAELEAGNRPIADVLQQRASIAQTEQRLIAARRDRDLARLELMQSLNLPSDGTFSFAAPPQQLLSSSQVEYDAGQLVRSAISDRPDVRAQRLHIEAADEGIRAARGGYYPSVNLNAGTGSNYSSLNDEFGLVDQLSDVNRNGSIGLSVSIPIFDRMQTKSSVDRAKVSASNERLAMEQLEQQVAFAVQQSLLDYRSAQAQLEAAERQLDSAEESLRAAEARYDVGASTLLEVTEARRLFVEASTGRIQAQYNLLLNQLGIAYQTGDLNETLATMGVSS